MHKVIRKNNPSINSSEHSNFSRGNVIVCRGESHSSNEVQNHQNFQGQDRADFIQEFAGQSASPNLNVPQTSSKDILVHDISSSPKKKFVIQAKADELLNRGPSTNERNKTDSNDSKDVSGEKKVFTCVECKKDFKHKSYFDYHIRTHTGERPHTCHICSKGFFERSKLNRHLSTCHEIKNTSYHSIEDDKSARTCTKCSKTFSRVSGLQAHLLTHEKIQPFSCTKCSQKFSGLTALKNHEKSHEGVKNIMCDICGKLFLIKKYLDLHLKTTHKIEDRQYKCPNCWREFYSTKDLKRHQLMHSGDKNFKCNLCKASFKRKDNFNRHLKLTHLLTPEQIKERETEEDSSEMHIISNSTSDVSSAREEEFPARRDDIIGIEMPRQVSVIRSTQEFIMSYARNQQMLN